MSKLAFLKTDGYVVEVGKTYPLGIEATIQCVKDIGQYIIDNAETIGNTARECIGVRIEGQVWIDSIPTVCLIFQRVNAERLEEIIKEVEGKV